MIGEDSNGKTEVVPTTAAGLMLALPDDTADSYIWQLATYDTSVLKLQGDPTFVPSSPGSTKCARVWSFGIAGPGTTVLKLQYADQAGTVKQQFSVTISVEQLSVNPQ